MATSKVIKEIVTDVGGNTTIEYSDDTTQKYNVADVVTAQVNPLTGGISLLAGDRNASVGLRIRTTIASAKNNNPQVLAPISAAPTWVINNVYGAGATVRGTGADAGNLYFLAGNATTTNAEGTSAAAGSGPSGTGAALITDNTCRWMYVGKAAATDAATPFLSTAPLASATDDMNGYLQLVPSTITASIGLAGYRPSIVTGSYATEAWFAGGLFSSRNAERVNGVNSGTVAAPTYSSSSERGSFAFKTNSRKWIGLYAQSSFTPKNVSYEFIVNGRKLSESNFVLGADSAANNRVFLLNLSKFPEGVKTVEVRVGNNIQSRIAFEVYVEADAFVWPIENPNRWKFAVEGDSISQGAYITEAYKPSYWIERIIGDHLGCDAVYNNAQGGTGAIANGNGTKTTYLERLSDIVDFAPDVLFVGGFHNDAGESGNNTSVNRRAAILAYLQAVRAALPQVFIVMVGAQLLSGDSLVAGATTQHQVEVDAKAAFDTFADSNSLFIQLLTGSKTRVTSANGKHFLSNGPTPYTDTHPIPAYYQFFGGMIAEKIAAWMASR